ncbi:MAG: hypothetical protein DMF32_10540 [Verrucomicrobia bacterium]|nr:MAG: hypothetical protein DMF32_10540 [Verrucomicrobiota bacterium]
MNHGFCKTSNVIQSPLAVSLITFTSCVISRKKFPTAKVVEILKKDSSKFIKTLGVPNFHWQDGYGLFGVSPSNLEAVRKYILDPEEHHKKETFQDEYLRILKRRSEGVRSATMAQAVGLPSEIGSHCCTRFKRNARSDFVSASSNALRNCSAAASRLFSRISSSPITE